MSIRLEWESPESHAGHCVRAAMYKGGISGNFYSERHANAIDVLPRWMSSDTCFVEQTESVNGSICAAAEI